MERLKKSLRIEVLGRSEESIDISRDDIQQRFHPIFIVQACLFLICLHLPQQLFLFIVKETVYEIKAIMSSL